MNEIPLTTFLKAHTQTETARQIGITQSRVSQLVRAKCDVYVVVTEEGSVSSAYEKRKIGKQARPPV
ncbi:Cro/CI family transcriptional regulator [Zymobacter palmae]|uniref:Cro/CI family transcriptional regulator n=1 Tax=Zymobacter palmae TaxID=33074 RepID=UPI000E769ACC